MRPMGREGKGFAIEDGSGGVRERRFDAEKKTEFTAETQRHGGRAEKQKRESKPESAEGAEGAEKNRLGSDEIDGLAGESACPTRGKWHNRERHALAHALDRPVAA